LRPWAAAGGGPGLALGLAFALALAGGCGDRGPAARDAGMQGPYHDFGILDLGTQETHSFDIPVPAGERVAPQSYSGDCSCGIGVVLILRPDGSEKLVYGLPPDQCILTPGDRVRLRLTLDTRYKEPIDVGRTLSHGQVHFAHVHGSTARPSIQRLSFHYGIRSPVEIRPVAHVDFGKLAASETFRQTLTIRGKLPDQRVELGAPTSSHAGVTVHIEPEGDAYLLHVEVSAAGQERRNVVGEISLPTNLGHCPTLGIKFSGQFIDDIEYQPAPYVGFQMFDFSEEKQEFVNIVDHDVARPPGFVLHSIESPHGDDVGEHFAVSFQLLGDRTTRVYVKYLGTMGGRSMRARLRLAKEAGGEPIAEVSINGFNKQS
jgi:hypothetical protein